MFPESAASAKQDLSREYFDRALRITPGGVHSPVRAFKGVGGTPVFFRSAQGATMTSVDGREYIDFCQSFGPLILGHLDPDVSEAVREATDTAWSFVAGETLVAPLDDENAGREIFGQFGQEIAAVILEPLPANYGLLIQRREFIEELVRLARANGALVIFDEVISGFRVALGGMAEVLGIRPDLVTYGKVIGGGFPVACYGGRKDLMELVAPSGPVYQAGTLSANPVGMRAGFATLQKAERVNAYAQLEERTAQLCDRLNSDFEQRGLPFQITRRASIFWLHVATDQPIRRSYQIPRHNAAVFGS